MIVRTTHFLLKINNNKLNILCPRFPNTSTQSSSRDALGDDFPHVRSSVGRWVLGNSIRWTNHKLCRHFWQKKAVESYSFVGIYLLWIGQFCAGHMMVIAFAPFAQGCFPCMRRDRTVGSECRMTWLMLPWCLSVADGLQRSTFGEKGSGVCLSANNKANWKFEAKICSISDVTYKCAAMRNFKRASLPQKMQRPTQHGKKCSISCSRDWSKFADIWAAWYYIHPLVIQRPSAPTSRESNRRL